MMNFLFIFVNVTIPIFTIIAAGFALNKKFDLNVNTLSKVQMYLLMPALLFSKIYSSNVENSLFLFIMFYCVILFFILYVGCWSLGKVLGYKRSLNSAFINSVCLYNSGNYCMPLIQLLYNTSYAFSIQIIVMVTQNILANTVGIFNSNVGNKGLKAALAQTFKVPMIYVVITAVMARVFQIPVWTPLLSSMDLLGQGLVPLALVTLGAQLATTSFSFNIPKVYLANTIRLLVAPAIAYGLVLIMGLQGVVGQVLVICSAAPSAVNSILLALEYENEVDFASKAIFTSTVFSSVTVTIVIFFATRFI